jgi:SAM-dependent methyltransferase
MRAWPRSINKDPGIRASFWLCCPSESVCGNFSLSPVIAFGGKVGLESDEQVEKIRLAYDLTVEQYHKGIDPLNEVPEDFKNSPDFRAFMKEAGSSATGSNAPENKEYLEPEKGMRYLDAGCGANLAVHEFYKWPSVFYGLDISSALIDEMEKFVKRRGLQIGGLDVAEIVSLPFEGSFFDIAMLIGVLEYYSLDYAKEALEEMNRVLKPSAKLVVDIANLNHPHVDIMFKLEAYLKRPHIPKSREDFEKILKPLFLIDKVDDSKVMLKYFVRNRT